MLLLQGISKFPDMTGSMGLPWLIYTIILKSKARQIIMQCFLFYVSNCFSKAKYLV
jgi:hypothetical protein